MMRREEEDERGRSRSRSPHRSKRQTRSSSFSDFSSKSPEPRHQPTPSVRECKIFVDRLTRNVHEGHLREIFGLYGHLQSVKHNRQRGWAHLVYDGANESEGDAAVEGAIRGMDGGQIDGSVIRVSAYRSTSHGKSHSNSSDHQYQRYNDHRGHAHDSHRRPSFRSSRRSRSP